MVRIEIEVEGFFINRIFDNISDEEGNRYLEAFERFNSDEVRCNSEEFRHLDKYFEKFQIEVLMQVNSLIQERLNGTGIGFYPPLSWGNMNFFELTIE